MHKKTVLVTGGAGFIGRHTVNFLNNENYNVIVADKKTCPQNMPAVYYRLDVSTRGLRKVFEENKIDYIIHLAALPSVAKSIKMPMTDLKDNFKSTVNICLAAKEFNIKKLVFSSTAAVYAVPKYLPVDELHPTSFLSPYAISKNASENFIKYIGIDSIIFRYANVYGAGQDCEGEAGVVAKFFNLMNKNKRIEIHGSGNQFRDFIYVSDVAKANVLALELPVKNEIINVSTNHKTSVNELVSIMKSSLDYDLKPIYTKARIGDIEKSVLDNSKLINLFKFTPSIDLKTGIGIMAEQF